MQSHRSAATKLTVSKHPGFESFQGESPAVQHAISMATPIAHKGVVAGAKVQAMTLLDLMMQPTLVADAKRYFTDVQTKTVKYKPLMAPSDQPAIWLNAEKMARYRDEMRKYYYDPTKYATYLEQLGITYPTIPPVP